MTFAAQIVMAPMAGRRADRRAVDAHGTLRDAAARPSDVTVQDISTTGFAVRAATPLAIGATVRLGIVGLSTESAIVVRATGDLYGCAFDQPISPARVRAAGAGTTVHVGAFDALPTAIEPDHVHTMSRRARGAIIVSVSLALWTTIIVVATAALTTPIA